MPNPKELRGKAKNRLKGKSGNKLASGLDLAGERMKRAYLRSKARAENLNDDSSSTPDDYAERQVEDNAENVALDTGIALVNTGKRASRAAREKRKSKDRAESAKSEPERLEPIQNVTNEQAPSDDLSHEAHDSKRSGRWKQRSGADDRGDYPARVKEHHNASDDHKQRQIGYATLKERQIRGCQKKKAIKSRERAKNVHEANGASSRPQIQKATALNCDDRTLARSDSEARDERKASQKPLIRERGEQRIKEKSRNSIRVKPVEDTRVLATNRNEPKFEQENGQVLKDGPSRDMLEKKTELSSLQPSAKKSGPSIQERMLISSKGREAERPKSKIAVNQAGVLESNESGAKVMDFSWSNAENCAYSGEKPSINVEKQGERGTKRAEMPGWSSTAKKQQPRQQKVKTRHETVAEKKAARSIKGSNAKEKRLARSGRPTRMQATLTRQKREAAASKKAAQKAKIALEKSAKAEREAAKATARSIKASIAAIKGLVAAAASGGSVVVIAVIILCLIALVVISPFGIFFAGSDSSTDSVPVSVAVAQVNYDFGAYLIELQDGNYSSITLTGDIADWVDVIAVFAVKTTEDETNPMDVATLDATRVDKLIEVFWDMNDVTSSVATVDHLDSNPDDNINDSWTETNLTITITAKTAEDMKNGYSFSDEQKKSLDELLEKREALAALIGETSLISTDAIEILRNLPSDLDPELRKVVRIACSLVGKVNYFWGGKSLVLGWDDRWGTLKQVAAEGSSTTGRFLPYGMDCSGFVDWVFFNASDGRYIIGRGGGATMQHENCQDITWDATLPGDLVFYPDNSHVGIVAGAASRRSSISRKTWTATMCTRIFTTMTIWDGITLTSWTPCRYRSI